MNVLVALFLETKINRQLTNNLIVSRREFTWRWPGKLGVFSNLVMEVVVVVIDKVSCCCCWALAVAHNLRAFTCSDDGDYSSKIIDAVSPDLLLANIDLRLLLLVVVN